MLFLFISIIISILDGAPSYDGSFSFITSHQKEFTLKSPKKFMRNKNNAISSIFRKVLGQNNNNKLRQGYWYYVHFLTKDISNVQKYIKIESKDEIIKNTFLLFLTSEQIEKISNISLIKKLDPYEKYYEEGGSITNVDHLIVHTLPQYSLQENNEFYHIETKNNDDYYILKINNNNKHKVIRLLTTIPEVKSVSTYKEPVAANSIMAGFTQKNNFDFKNYHDSEFFYLDRYLNDKGITGENQTITILDTPIDFYHSMFRDDNHPIELNKYMPDHRKIIYYGYSGDLNKLKEKMEEDEHGTHVAGTAAGKSICTNDDAGTQFFNGNAPDSKILFAGFFNDVQPNQLGQMMNQYNSKISSNSWGVKAFYNPINFGYGQLAEKNPNLTFIFCAGNEYETTGNFSIRDPSGSKNVLTVGSISDFYIDYDIFYIYDVNNPSSYYTAIGINFVDPWFIGTIGTEPGKCDILIIDVDKGNQCKQMQNNNKFYLYGKNTKWIDSCKLKGNPSFLLDYNNEKKLDDNMNVYISKLMKIDESKKITRASYSSTGPANKGILKPDVMAPGTKIISAKSRAKSSSPHGCRDDKERDFIFMDGTSMATPNAAGAAALVHQYFQSGKWKDKVELDGATTRALLINSCTHPFNSKTPDNIYGHGTIDLSTIIPIEKDFGVQITQQNMNDKSHYVTENGHVTSKLNVNNRLNKKLQITLSYIDKMLNMDSPIPITRDLDLVVVSPSKKVYLGDHLNNKDTQHASTNEKVIIDEDELENGEYTIHVYGGVFADSVIPDGPKKQDFAVVATGPITNGYLIFSDSSECPCDKCDQNRPGYCICNEDEKVGPICQAQIETIYGNEGSFALDPLEVKRVRFQSNKKIKYIFSKSENPGLDSTIWVSRKCHLSLGEYEVNGITKEEDAYLKARTKANFGTNDVCVAIFNNNDKQSTYIINVSNQAKLNWVFITIVSLSVAVFIGLLIFCICCCTKNKCCKCCRCCNCSRCCICCKNCHRSGRSESGSFLQYPSQYQQPIIEIN